MGRLFCPLLFNPWNYSYLSDGTKLSAMDAGGNGLVYSGSLVYRKQNDTLSLESAAFSAGRFIATTAGIETRYFITDHLGSVRVIVNHQGEVIERNDYYPFGMHWEDGAQLSDNRYLFNGKETQEFVNVPYSDYGARMLDSKYRLGWLGQDVLAEKNFSIGSYVFCANNPIRLIDNNGKDWYSYEEEYEDKNGETKTRTRYKYIREQLSENEMQEKGLKYKGRTYDDRNGTYYSLGGAIATYDPSKVLDIVGLQAIKNADANVETAIGLFKSAGDFWDNYNSIIGLGSDLASIAGTFMNASQDFRGAVGSIGGIMAGINLMGAYNTYQNGEKGLAFADATAAVVSLMSYPGAIASIYYTGGKKIIEKEIELEGVLRARMRGLRKLGPGYW